MTRGGLSIDQKMVDGFVDSIIKDPTDFGKVHSLQNLGFGDIKVDFRKSREFFSRGLCLDLQRRERGTVKGLKVGDVEKALESDNPLEFLKSKGYDSKTLARLARLAQTK